MRATTALDFSTPALTAGVAPPPQSTTRAVLPSCPLPYGEVVSASPAAMVVRLQEKDSDAVFASFVALGGADYAHLHVPNNYGPRRTSILDVPSGTRLASYASLALSLCYVCTWML